MKAKPPAKIQKATNPSTRTHWNEMNRKQRREMMRQIQSEDISLEVVHPNAAGIDIGNESHYAAVPPSRDNQPVRCFACTTAELKAMADWLKQCGIRTVAMQSTGVYWIALYDSTGGCRKGAGGFAEAVRQIRFDPAPGEDTADCVRAFCTRGGEEAGREKARHPRLSRLQCAAEAHG
jgi:hypothetical protein